MKLHYAKGEEPLEIRKLEFVTWPPLPGGKARVKVQIWTLTGLRWWGHNNRPPDMDVSLEEFVRCTRMDSALSAHGAA